MTLPRTVVESSSMVPEGTLAVLSQAEVNDLCVATRGPLYAMFRRCALAALTCEADACTRQSHGETGTSERSGNDNANAGVTVAPPATASNTTIDHGRRR